MVLQQSSDRPPFYLGGVAAIGAGIITHPIDQTKIRVQTQSPSLGMIRTFVASYKRGGTRGLWDGVSASILRQGTYSTTRFGVYAKGKEYLEDRRVRMGFEASSVPGWQLVGCGTVAGGLGGLAGVPTELVLVRMCSDCIKPPPEQLGYKNAFEGLVRIVKSEGVTQLYRGVGTVVVRSMLMNGTQLAAYDKIKAYFLSNRHWEDNAACHVMSSLIGGTLSCAVCAPVDVVKARVQAATGDANPFRILRSSLKQEGVSFLFRGFVPAWCRLMPTTILIFVFLEKLKELSGRYDFVFLPLALPTPIVLALLSEPLFSASSAASPFLTSTELHAAGLSVPDAGEGKSWVIIEAGRQINTGPLYVPGGKSNFLECKIEIPFLRHPGTPSALPITLKASLIFDSLMMRLSSSHLMGFNAHRTTFKLGETDLAEYEAEGWMVLSAAGTEEGRREEAWSEKLVRDVVQGWWVGGKGANATRFEMTPLSPPKARDAIRAKIHLPSFLGKSLAEIKPLMKGEWAVDEEGWLTATGDGWELSESTKMEAAKLASLS